MGRAVGIIGTWAVGFASWTYSMTMAIFFAKSPKCNTRLKKNFYRVFLGKTDGVW